VSFGGFDYCFLFVIGGAGNELESTLLTLILTHLKTSTYSVCGFGCTFLNPTQILLNHFLAQNSFFKICSQIGNPLLKLGVLILLKLGVLFGRIEKLILERVIQLTQRGQNNVTRRMIKFVIKIFNLNGSRL
jgi:hypothetical protein